MRRCQFSHLCRENLCCLWQQLFCIAFSSIIQHPPGFLNILLYYSIAFVSINGKFTESMIAVFCNNTFFIFMGLQFF